MLNRFRKNSDLRRAPASLTAGKRLLIVCEGKKTEPNYFKSVRRDLGLRNADVQVCGAECGTDPMSVFNYAMELFDQDRTFDDVFCVFDKEGTKERKLKYDEARRKITQKKMGKGKSITAIHSVPCFEFWYLLHFNFSDAPFVAERERSCADMAVSALKKIKGMEKYEKSSNNVYDILKDKLDVALINGPRSLASAEARGSDNPSTNAHLLVQALHNLAKK